MENKIKKLLASLPEYWVAIMFIIILCIALSHNH